MNPVLWDGFPDSGIRKASLREIGQEPRLAEYPRFERKALSAAPDAIAHADAHQVLASRKLWERH